MTDFVMVPVEPTAKMFQAALKVSGATVFGIASMEAWKAMLAARPVDELRELQSTLNDATSALAYIHHSYGELYGVGWDRVLPDRDKSIPSTRIG